MKILFAVNNDNISEAIIKKYQKEYKEILSYKNVYYFNAILRELQKDKNYDRIVISEDLEPFANNNYESIDKFLFEKYSNISEEAKSTNNNRIDIILICADRRKKTDSMLTKVYKKKIYNAIVGQDRSIEEVCRLINMPRDKEEAKRYYGIYEGELGENNTEESVSEAEVENIIAHYARLGKNEDKYIQSFNNIVTQYTDNQLRIIIKYLPMHVKAVLEAKSPKYQQLIVVSALKGIDAKKKTEKYKKELKKTKKEDELVQQLIKPKNIKSVVIPTALSSKNVQKVENSQVKTVENNKVESEPIVKVENNEQQVEKTNEQNQNVEIQEQPKRGRGRPRKNPLPQEQEQKPKRGRGRPRKNPVVLEEPEEIRVETIEKPEKEVDESEPEKVEAKQPEIDLFNIEPELEINEPKVDLFNIESEAEEDDEPEVDLFNIDSEAEEDDEPEVDLFNIESEAEEYDEPEVDLFNIDSEAEEDDEPEVDLFNIESEAEEDDEPEVDLFNIESEDEDEPKVDLFNIESEDEEETEPEDDLFDEESEDEEDIESEDDLFSIESEEDEDDTDILETTVSDTEYNTLLTSDKKIVAFVGTTKNGTSFVVNNTAEMLSSMGIETAILDLTKSKNAYYIYTNNEEELRLVARDCMENLQRGITAGIKVNKNLTVYTEMPGEEKEYDIQTVLETLLNRYSAILIDTDFNTNLEVFEKVQEIYLVQTMDVLTIQPLTAFLRNLKSKNILQSEKLKIVINKAERIRSLNIKTLIGGMSCYNSPNMTYMTELFNKDNVPYCEIPFEVQNYVKYLESLVNCSISLNGYTKQLIASLKELANMVYPLVNKQKKSKDKKETFVEPFSSQINNTLNKMKKKY